MKIGVPGEFHEDRWQRTAEDYERRVIPRTREVGGTHRIQVIAWLSVLQIGLRYGHHAHKYPSGIPAERRGYLSGLRHGDPAHRYLSAIPAWRRGSSAHQKGHFVHQESQFVHQDGHFVSIFMQKAAYSGMASDLTYS